MLVFKTYAALILYVNEDKSHYSFIRLAYKSIFLSTFVLVNNLYSLYTYIIRNNNKPRQSDQNNG